jgi:hypothetical protein
MAKRRASDARHAAILPTFMNVAFVLAATLGVHVLSVVSFKWFRSDIIEAVVLT